MRLASLLMGTLAFLSITSAQAYTYKCTEINPTSSITKVTIEELEDVTDSVTFGDRYDSVSKVKVDIVVKKDKKIIEEKSFESYATTEDVFYQISAVKKEGVKFFLFLDEENQAGIEFINQDGVKRKMQLSCR